MRYHIPYTDIYTRLGWAKHIITYTHIFSWLLSRYNKIMHVLITNTKATSAVVCAEVDHSQQLLHSCSLRQRTFFSVQHILVCCYLKIVRFFNTNCCVACSLGHVKNFTFTEYFSSQCMFIPYRQVKDALFIQASHISYI